MKLIIMVFNNDSIKVSPDLSNDIGRLLSLDQQLERGIKSCNVIELSHLFYEYYDNAEGNRNLDKIAGLRWMMNQCFHLNMDKTWSVYDWSQFPLSTAKLSYACNDVTSMMKIYRFLNPHYMNDNNNSSYEKPIIVSNHTSKFSFVECVMQAKSHKDKATSVLRKWGKSFFQEYRLKIDYIVNAINRRIPQRFRERRDNIEKRAMINCERGRWWQRNAAVRLAVEPFIVADICANEEVLDSKSPGDWNTPISSWDPNYCHKKFLELTGYEKSNF
ncbi:unnamed protein product [Didymodactylos carnosus]|uniref:3'-5' exonuclease domain-containing protein n=1 Tax=Didymodactylos carnosus TaxID=1234261 RepID=A0A815R2B9_9BILA|nr:unnamed protein product [Didymodactylos carnosus]CAF4339147.1 unnamed protein product [Didymodactylos carnosus]